MIVELAMVVIAIKLALEDAGHGARYQDSPRRAARRRDRGRQNRRGPVRKAAGRYINDLADDAGNAVRARRAKRAARRRASKSGDGRFTDFDPRTQRWTPSCDVCGWTGNARRVEAHADAERHTHTCQQAPATTPNTTPSRTATATNAAGKPSPRRPESAPEEPEVTAAAPPPSNQPQGAAPMSDAEAIQQVRDALASGLPWAETQHGAASAQRDNATATAEAMGLAATAFQQAAERYANTEIVKNCAHPLDDVAEAVQSASDAYNTAAEALGVAVNSLAAAIDSFNSAITELEAAVGEFESGASEGAEAVAAGTAAGV